MATILANNFDTHLLVFLYYNLVDDIFLDECHEAAHKDQNNDNCEAVPASSFPPPSSASREMKRNHEDVFQETKPRIARRHSYGK